MKTAFPCAARASDGQEATATLIKIGEGWQVQNVSSANQAAGE
jgi:hypothetical protein